MQHDRTKPRPELRALLAAVIWSPLEVATDLGEERWRTAQRTLDDFVLANTGPAGCRTGPGVYVCALHDADAAIDLSTELLRHAYALGVPLQLAIHAGEVMVDERAFSGIATLAALHAATFARPGEIMLTQPAKTMCRSRPADFAPAGRWQPPGHSVAMRLYRKTTECSPPEPPPNRMSGVVTTSPILSQREREVVLFVARGFSNREIATALDIAVGTVERHVANILKKLQFRSRTQIARWAVEEGMIEAVDAVP